MATKKTATTATTKKAATKPAKKAAKKVAAKKVTKKATKKVAKKTAKKKAVKKVTAVEQELNLAPKSAATFAQLEEAAYLNYLERLQNNQPGSPESDWEKAQQDLA